MKKYAAFAAFAMAALAAAAVQTPPGRIAERDVLMQFLEYRDAGSPALFRASAARLREIADSKIDGDAPPAAKFRRAMAMTLVATYSMDPAARSFAPESLSIDAAARDSYFASARETLDAFAARAKEKKPGEPSWKLYLDALEEGVKAESADSAAEKDRLVKSALAKLEQAADKGDKRAKLRLAQTLLHRSASAKSPRERLAMEKRAVKLPEDAGEFREGADADRHGASPSALNLLGKCLEYGIGDRDGKGKPRPRPKSALRAYIDAASTDHPDALHNLARFRLAGTGGAVKDPAAAYRAEHAAAEAGHPDAMAEWGRLLMDGAAGTNGETLVKQDVKAGREWIRNAAEEGSARGAYYLGSMLANETPQTPETAADAAKWLNAAAVAIKSPQVRYEAAKALLAPGAADAASELRAVVHLSQAAKRNHVESMELLAECLEKGRGVTQSNDEAVFWRMKARALRGDVAAAAWLKKRARDRGE